MADHPALTRERAGRSATLPERFWCGRPGTTDPAGRPLVAAPSSAGSFRPPRRGGDIEVLPLLPRPLATRSTTQCRGATSWRSTGALHVPVPLSFFSLARREVRRRGEGRGAAGGRAGPPVAGPRVRSGGVGC